ncbi:hypothetical protein VST7929_01008 [Vibrio stylophorae]|uniref:DUF3568 domain-containing protein n=1 Tax=Vibrio stylophorae TaxID=659351 RepID=A0ABN8DR70_9VIBR|nr:hypothetical protein [Vibrio stylophorae]CAH0533147.1 hypothetical protein VST7929_01008 [Vibrio stylophorae]
MRKVLFVVGALLLSGCMSTGSQQVAKNDPRPCAKNLTVEGSFITGRQFKTTGFVSGTSKNKAYQKVYKHLAMEGWNIVNANKEMGIINASQAVSFGEGETAPLNVMVEPQKGGVDVFVSFAIGGGVSTSKDAVIDAFCKIVLSAK